MSPWALLTVAGLMEVVWATAMKASDGFTRPGLTALTVVAAVVSFWMLGIAMRSLPLGTAYGVWVGIGAAGAAILGIVWFADPITPLRIAGLALIGAGVIALKLA